MGDIKAADATTGGKMRLVLTLSNENGEEADVELTCRRSAASEGALFDALDAAVKDTEGKPGDSDGWRIQAWGMP